MPIRAIGIDIGGTYTKLAIVSEDGEIQHLETLPTAAREDPQDYLARLGVAAAHFNLSTLGVPEIEVEQVGELFGLIQTRKLGEH